MYRIKSVISVYQKTGSRQWSTIPLTSQELYKLLPCTQNKQQHFQKSVTWEDAIPFNQMPGPKPLPILGNTWRFTHGEFKGLDPVELYQTLNETYGSICRLTKVIGMPNTVFLFEPDDIREMYLNEGTWPVRNVLKAVTHYRKVVRKEIFGEVPGLPSSQGEEWFKIRTATNPILMKPKISEEFIPKIEIVAKEFVKRIDKLARGPEMSEDFMKELIKHVMESISYVTFNKHFDLMKDTLSPETKQLLTSSMRVFELCYELDMKPSIWAIIPTPKWREFVYHMDILTDVYMKIIDQEIKQNEAEKGISNIENRCLLQKFLAVDKKLAVAMVFDTLAAGIDTTSKTIGATLYLLAKHQRVQAKLRQELIEVFPDYDTPITPEHLNKCKYLRAVIKESSRVHGIAIAQLRCATKDFVIAGYQIPKGVNLIGVQSIMAKSEKYIKRAKEYIPERFLREYANEDISMSKVHKHIYLPFGFGPRSCVGKRIANLELEITLAMLVRKFRLEWKQPKMRFRAKLMYELADPLKLHFYPIDENYKDDIIDLNKLDYAPELE